MAEIVKVEGPAITPGERTTEFAAMQSSSLFGKILMIVGIVMGVLNEIIPIFLATGLDQTTWGGRILTGFGVILAICGAIMKAMGVNKYIEGRSLVKASAAHNLPPPPEV